MVKPLHRIKISNKLTTITTTTITTTTTTKRIAVRIFTVNYSCGNYTGFSVVVVVIIIIIIITVVFVIPLVA